MSIYATSVEGFTSNIHRLLKRRDQMKVGKTTVFFLMSIAITFCTFIVSKSIIDERDFQYDEENPLIKKEILENQAYQVDIDKIISHGMYGAKRTTLPIKYDEKYTIYEDKLYVTNNKGVAWLQVPDDDYLGYARISEYVETISTSNLYISDEKIAIVYGGRGPENISIIRTDSQGEYWSIGSISKTATHDLQKGYERMYIDFLDDERTGYLVAIRNEGTVQENVLVYRSVNSGITWDYVDTYEDIYSEIMTEFGL